MRRGYSYLELIVTLGILAVLGGSFLCWQRGYVRQMRAVLGYYQERQTALNRLAAGDYDRTEIRGGLKHHILNWRGREIIVLGW
jgi:type II secretory pathway pseudopilin PulG